MSFKLVLLLAWRKITFQKTRSIVMALPIVVMVAIIVALSGWVGGFKNFIDREVLEPVARQSVLLTVEYPQHQVSADPYSLSPVFTSMPQDKVTALESLPGVSSAAPSSWQTYPADITFDDIPLQNAIVRTRTLDSSLSSLFGATDFVFHPGQPIPIIISGQALQEFVIDFGDKDTITRSTICNMPDHSDCQGPIKQVDHRELLNQQLIGQMGTMSYQLMPKPPQVISSYQGSQQTFRKASQKQLNAYQHQLERIFSPYWDLDQLEQPEQFRFRVVGIDKSRDLPSNYIPTEAAVYIYNRLHQLPEPVWHRV